MRSKLWIVVLVSVAAVFFLTGTGFSEEKVNQGEKTGTVSDEARAVQDLNLADELVEYGRRVENPLALVVAAQIMKNTPTQDQQRSKETEGEASASAEGKKSKEMDTPESLLTEAKSMAEKANNELIVGLVDKESKIVAQRGRVGGAVEHYDQVDSGTTDVYRGVRFSGGELARVAVIGDGDCDLDLYVYDENDNLIESDTDYTDACFVEWVPSWTGPFTIKVKNYQCNVYANYALLTN